MADQEFKIDEVFESAVAIVRNLPKEGPIKPSDALKLTLYAYFKQATHGPNDTPKPKFYQFVESYKWDAWHKLGDMSKEDAMSNYIAELKKIMDTIPKDDSTTDDNQHFEKILGKKFYDYWFNEWNNQKSRTLTDSSSRDSHFMESARSNLVQETASSCQLDDPTGSTIRANDTHSNSSDNSSMSLLEETQSPEVEGYKTPNSLEQCNITGQMGDQVASAVLRLQHGLVEMNSRLSNIEGQIANSIDRIQVLENQTYVKGRFAGGTGSASSSESRAGCGGNKLINLLTRMNSVHWFYLSYPLIVYAILRAYERRRRKP